MNIDIDETIPSLTAYPTVRLFFCVEDATWIADPIFEKKQQVVSALLKLPHFLLVWETSMARFLTKNRCLSLKISHQSRIFHSSLSL